MSAKEIIRQLLPPIVVTVARKIAGKQTPADERRATFDGVYPTLHAVPIRADKAIYENAKIVELLRAEAQQDLALLASHNGSLPCRTYTSESPDLLPELVAVMATNVQRPIRVLDFGGGLGDGYRNCLRMLPPTVHYEFVIVELPGMTETGNEIFAGYPNISFQPTIPATAGSFDIINIGTSLEYISDYRRLLMDLIGLQCKYILFTEMFFYGGETYATRQNNFAVADSPYWIFGFQEIADILRAGGYRQIYTSANPGIQTFANVPAAKQIPNSTNVLFVRDDKK